MALTVTRDQVNAGGGWTEVLGTVTFDSSYATGGESFVPADVGLTQFYNVTVQAPGYQVRYVSSTGKLLVYGGAAGSGGVAVEVSNATDLSTIVCAFSAKGV